MNEENLTAASVAAGQLMGTLIVIHRDSLDHPASQILIGDMVSATMGVQNRINHLLALHEEANKRKDKE